MWDLYWKQFSLAQNKSGAFYSFVFQCRHKYYSQKTCKNGHKSSDSSNVTLYMTFRGISKLSSSRMSLSNFCSEIPGLMALVPRVESFFVWIIVDHGIPLEFVRKGYIYIFERICMGIVNVVQRCVLFFILYTRVLPSKWTAHRG